MQIRSIKFGGKYMSMFKSKCVEDKYNERMKRYLVAMNGGTPDRIPVRFFFQEVAARYCGYTTQQVACDYNLAFDATRKMAEDMNVDAVMLNAIWSNYGVGKSAGLKYLNVPGVDVDMKTVLQYSEPDNDDDIFLKLEEYDEFMQDPTEFLFAKWLPRASSRINSVGEKVTVDHNIALISGSMAYANYMNAFGPASNKLKYDAGIVSANSGMIKAPFDILADKFRGYVNLAIDCIERPEVVLKACEALMPHIVANALSTADPDKNVPITLWAHRGCIPFVSMDTFTNIYWATLKPVLEEITAKGYQVLFYGEGNWEPHYDALLEMKPNTMIYHIDRGDFKKAVKLKDKFALSGGVSYDVLSRGTKEDVQNHLKELFSILATDGAYILDASALMLNDINPDNIKTAVEYTMEHGVYSQSSANTNIRPKAIYDAPAVKANGDARLPLVCRPWEVESAQYRNLTGDIDLVKNSWQAVDNMAYNYAWTTVLW